VDYLPCSVYHALPPSQPDLGIVMHGRGAGRSNPVLPVISSLVRQRAVAGGTTSDTYSAVQDLGRRVASTAHSAVPLSQLMADPRLFPTRKAVSEMVYAARRGDTCDGSLVSTNRITFDDLSELAIISDMNPGHMLHVPVGSVNSSGKTYTIPHVTVVATRAMQAFAG
jgi:hypothetical protein